MEAAFGLLEQLVDDAMSWIDIDLSANGERRNLLWRYCGRGAPPLPGEETKTHGDNDDEETEKENASTMRRYATSPFDLFHYCNSAEAGSVVNCNRHVGESHYSPLWKQLKESLSCTVPIDPGFMTAVPCAATPGLEVLDAATLEWIRVPPRHELHFVIPLN